MAERTEKHGFAKQAFDKVGVFITCQGEKEREFIKKQCFYLSRQICQQNNYLVRIKYIRERER